MKDEVGRVHADLRQLLRSLKGPADSATTRPTGPVDSARPIPSGVGSLHTEAGGAGLSISEEGLRRILDGALTGAGRGTEGPRLSLDRLVGAMKEARRSAPLPTGTTPGNDGTLTLSLTDLAKMLKKNPDVGGRSKDAPSSERRAPAHGVPRIPHRHPQTPPPSQQARRSSRPSHVCRAARFELIPDESEHYTHTIDDLAELLLSLHGVVYGSGYAPAGPEVEFDPSVAWGWARAQRAAAAPSTAERAEGLSSGAPAAGIESPAGSKAPVLSPRAPASQSGPRWTFDAATR